jgi:predicted peroxiredoxin
MSDINNNYRTLDKVQPKKICEMKNTGLLIIAGLLFISCNQNPKNVGTSNMDQKAIETPNSTKDGVFIHITESYNDPHRVLMPLKMATMMAMDKDVIVYMDIHAVELLVKGAKDMTFSDFDSFQSYVKQLIDKNVGVYACPTCLKIAGFKPEDLMDGVQVAQKDKFFNFTQGRIVTLDY